MNRYDVTVEFEQDGQRHVRKVRVSALELIDAVHQAWKELHLDVVKHRPETTCVFKVGSVVR